MKTVTNSAKHISTSLLVMFLLAAAFPMNAQRASKADIAKQLLQSKTAAGRPAAADLSNMRISSETYSTKSGVTHVYFQQELNGIPVHNAILDAHVTKDNELLTFGNRFVPEAKGKAKMTAPALTPEQAVEAAARALGNSFNGKLVVKESKGGATQAVVFEKGSFSLADIPVQLMWQPSEDGSLHLAWDLSIYEPDAQNWWSVRIDAQTGELLDKNNWVVHCNFGETGGNCAHAAGEPHFGEPAHLLLLDSLGSTSLIPQFPNSPIPPAAGGGSYRVFKEPVESPLYGVRTLVTDPAHAAASPYGWHDTDGVAGAEYTTTQGNNVFAALDAVAPNGADPGSSPDGGAGLVFDFPLDLTLAPSTYRPAAITNLFYWNNFIHDVIYQYGFDEASGNFQQNNYGKGGAGADYVLAEAQDYSGTCNANFASPPDGSRPRMQMYICSIATPARDGDLDNEVIVHEYAHGISIRLTGGPANSGCLGNEEQMGEGWSDWYGMMLTMQPGSNGATPQAMGEYLFGQSAGGAGIRPTPYSTGMSVNSSTYNTIKSLSISVPHGVGYVWATMIWDMTWALIGEHGASAGYDEAMSLVTEGLKLQPCSPGFVDGRNAILAADVALFGGANQCLIWEVFARRGLGFSASQGSSDSRFDGTQAFDMPPTCFNVTPALVYVCQPENAVFSVNAGMGIPNPATLSVSGNPAGTTVSFSTNPLNTPGTSTLTIGNTAAAAAGTYNLVVTADNGGQTFTENVVLTIQSGVPAAPSLTTPANMAAGVSNTNLAWSAAGGAETCEVQVATDAGFLNLVLSATNLTGSTYMATGLLPMTTYYWRMRAVNDCGTGAFSTTFSFTTSNTTACNSWVSTNVPVIISGAGTPTVTSTLNIPVCGTVSDVNVKNLQVGHTWVGDLIIELTSPSGTTVRLINQPCNFTRYQNLIVNLDDAAATSALPCPPTNNGAYRPNQPLSAFNGVTLNGNWTLTVKDVFVGDGGGLTNWELEICYQPGAAGTVACYADSDADTNGDPANTKIFCNTCGPGYVSNNTDCNDANPAINPAATEVCDGVDNNCDGNVDEGNVCCPAGNILYVKANASGANNGSSWTDAFTSLQSALASTCPGITQIWVAGGTCKPTTGNDRTISFVMKNGVAIYGGFPGQPGQEGNFGARNLLANVSVLSGDIGAAGNTDNSYTVVTGSGTNNTAILDGFTITGGNANAPAAPGNYESAARSGGGMYNSGGSPIVRNCYFTGNNAANFGGGMCNLSSTNTSPNVINCVFSGNTSANGGGLCNRGTRNSSVPVVTNCTIFGNTASLGGGVLADSSNTTLVNCIIWGNSSGVAIDPAGTVNITSSILQGGCPAFGATCTNIQNIDPLFVNQAGGNYRLTACSPALDAGNDAANTQTSDIDGNPRKFDAFAGGSMIDMGAYELQSAGATQSVVTVSVSPASTPEDGAGNLVYTFERNCPAAALTVNFNVGGTAAFSTDYSQTGAATFSASSGAVSFGAGVSTVTVTVDPTVDNAVELDETVILTLATGVGYTIGTPGNAAGAILNDDVVETANAGPDQTKCNNGSFTMAANNPAAGSGLWSVQSGTATITTPGSNTTTVTGLPAGTSATLRWTITNGITSSFDDVVLTNNLLVVSNAGSDQTQCNNGSFTLAGNSPSVGTGSWSLQSGTATITTPGNPASGITGVPAGTSATLRWTITNGVCPPSFDDVVLTNHALATVANAGGNQQVCGLSTALAANTPVTGTGAWSIQTGVGGVLTNSASPTSGFSGVAGTTYTLRWTITNGACSSQDDVLVTLANPEVSVAVTPGAVTENGASNLVYTLTRNCTFNAVTVNFSVGGTATLNTDYTQSGAASFSAASGTVTMGVGVGSASVTVNPAADLIVELDETVILTITAGAGYSVGASNAATGTIQNDDAAVISITNESVTEGNNGSNPAMTFTITMSMQSDASVNFNFATLDGTATVANSDYATNSGSHTLTPGQTSKTVMVTVNGDCAIESNENFTVRLSSLSNNSRAVTFSGNGASLDGTGAILNDDDLPVIACPASFNQNTNAGQCQATVTLTLPTVNGACGPPSLDFRHRMVNAANQPTGAWSNWIPSGSNTQVFAKGKHEIEWRATDGNGNSTCNIYADILDIENPVALCKPATVYLNSTGQINLAATQVDNGSSDNCNFTLSLSNSSFSCANVGPNTVTLTATDASGNMASCPATVNVVDNLPPSIFCENATVYLDGNGQAAITHATVFTGSSDNCGFIGLEPLAQTLYTCANTGQNTVTLNVFDGSGNTNSCSATLTVVDNLSPNLVCQNITIQLDGNGNANIAPADVFNAAASGDNCGAVNLVSVSPSQFDCGETGTNIVTLIANDGDPTGAGGNVANCQAVVTVLDFFTNISVAVTPEDCGMGNGVIVVTVDAPAGAGQIAYSVNGGASWQFSNTFSNLTAGTYSVVIQAFGGLGCTNDPSPTVVTSIGNPQAWYLDWDGDGYSAGVTMLSCVSPGTGWYLASQLTATAGDCNDYAALQYPGQTWYRDMDNDGYSDGTTLVQCLQPAGFKHATQLIQTSGDCNDGNPNIHPGATEVCNGLDDDCDGQVDEGLADLIYYGNVTFTNQAQVNAWSQCYTVIQGNLTIQNSGIGNLGSLKKLRKVTGNVLIKSTSLDSLSWLMKLDTIGGDLTVQTNAQLQTIHGLDSLKSVGGSLKQFFNLDCAECCAIYDLLNTPGGIGGATSISLNQTGCNSVAQINTGCAPPPSPMVNPNCPDCGYPVKEPLVLEVFPNPASSRVHLRLRGINKEGGVVTVSDQLGRVVFRQDLEAGEQQFTLHLDERRYESGAYFVRASSGYKIVVRKLVVAR